MIKKEFGGHEFPVERNDLFPQQNTCLHLQSCTLLYGSYCRPISCMNFYHNSCIQRITVTHFKYSSLKLGASRNKGPFSKGEVLLLMVMHH